MSSQTTADVSSVLDGIRGLYRDNIAQHGPVSKSVGWKDAGSQRLRFDKLAELVEPHIASHGFTCNDWGCGYAAMFDYFVQTRGWNVAGYHGYDICGEMLAEAQRRIDDPAAQFINSDAVTTPADYTFVSGTFNVKLEAADSDWQHYVADTLGQLWESSRRGLAFNLLTTFVDWQEPQLFYADPAFFFDFCKRQLSPRVSLLHDYPLYEWTILVRREVQE